MKIALICIGRTQQGPLRECIDRYCARIPHYIPFQIIELPDVKTTKTLTEQKQKEMEGAALLAALQPGDWLTLLDERGREYTSREFAKLLSDKMNVLPGRLVMAIGGPYGFSQKVYDRADAMHSLSKMTFPHEMVRLFITEQIYRAMTILRGEPYHHD
ncbi:MAG: 23S rRNA (pseudouridine(1915)-N(3))-methyltransferase RlmH [Bacteroidales bacterium]|nr:23S rRNA (pseudouridine(1915)-N(3))-methyltransferase RlmH [Bacteroidales bacterium]